VLVGYVSANTSTTARIVDTRNAHWIVLVRDSVTMGSVYVSQGTMGCHVRRYSALMTAVTTGHACVTGSAGANPTTADPTAASKHARTTATATESASTGSAGALTGLKDHSARFL